MTWLTGACHIAKAYHWRLMVSIYELKHVSVWAYVVALVRCEVLTSCYTLPNARSIILHEWNCWA